MNKRVNTLDKLQRIHRTRVQSDVRYRQALLQAVSDHGYAAVAKELGLSRQAVRQAVKREEKQ